MIDFFDSFWFGVFLDVVIVTMLLHVGWRIRNNKRRK